MTVGRDLAVTACELTELADLCCRGKCCGKNWQQGLEYVVSGTSDFGATGNWWCGDEPGLTN